MVRVTGAQLQDGGVEGLEKLFEMFDAPGNGTLQVGNLAEARLQRALERLLESRTSFVVAHRLSTIRRADLILVLDRGAIVDRGSHLELLARPGLYRSLYQQFALSDLS